MAELKTKATTASVRDFLNEVEPEEKRKDSFALLSMMGKITGEKAVMWGESMIGFGSYHYKSERSTQEGDWPCAAFSPRKQNLTIYIMAGFKDNQDLLKKLGKHKTSVGCLYVKRLSDIDLKILEEVIKGSVKHIRKAYPG